MDPQLKQRLLGALVLVAVAVLAVPMLLDGGYRAPASARRDMAPMPAEQFPETPQPLPGETADEIAHGLEATPDTLTELARGNPPPVAAPSAIEPPPSPPPAAPRKQVAVTTPPPARPAVATPPPSVAPAPVAPARPAAVAPAERWAVQLGSFSSRDNAELLLKRLRAAGVTAYVRETKESYGASFRVRAGPVDGRAAAVDLRERLARTPEFRGVLVRE